MSKYTSHYYCYHLHAYINIFNEGAAGGGMFINIG